MKYKHLSWAALAISVLVGCSDTDEAVVDDGRCHAPEGQGSPNSIAEVVDLMNTLPRPLTVACFMESLDRPMTVIASASVFSAQPAEAPQSPRGFAVYDELILSWVFSGKSSYVLEFAEERSFAQSLKAEIVMPIEEGDVTLEHAFAHIRDEGQTSTICGTCHQGERPDELDMYPGAYQSEALKPALAETVRLDDMQAYRESCDPIATPRRCAHYDAVFGGGPVVDGDFPRILPDIYD